MGVKVFYSSYQLGEAAITENHREGNLFSSVKPMLTKCIMKYCVFLR